MTLRVVCKIHIGICNQKPSLTTKIQPPEFLTGVIISTAEQEHWTHSQVNCSNPFNPLDFSFKKSNALRALWHVKVRTNDSCTPTSPGPAHKLPH